MAPKTYLWYVDAMHPTDYMAFFRPQLGTEAEGVIQAWRSSFVLHHNRLRQFGLSTPGALGFHVDNVDGTVHGLVFDPHKPLPDGWRWNNARKDFAVPFMTSQKIVDIAAARRIKEALSELGTYQPQPELAMALGFMTKYTWKNALGTGFASMGVEPNPAQILFCGSDGPVCVFAAHPTRFHELFIAESAAAQRPAFECTNSADTWEMPAGFEMITQSEWELLSAQYRVSQEKSNAQA